MQGHLEALAAALPALPDDAQSRKALSLSIEAIVPRMHELRDRLIKGGDPTAASESATLLRCTSALTPSPNLFKPAGRLPHLLPTPSFYMPATLSNLMLSLALPGTLR